MIDGTVVTGGGPVKALGGGRFAGYGVLFTSADDPDLENEFFVRATDFDLTDRGSVPLMWRHGLDPTFKGRKLARAVPYEDDKGVYFEMRMIATDELTEQLIALGNRSELAFSSGSASHVVEKTTMPNGTRRIDTWPIVELSMTPKDYAVEPRAAVVSLKTFAIETVPPFSELVGQQQLEQRAEKAVQKFYQMRAQFAWQQHEVAMRELGVAR